MTEPTAVTQLGQLASETFPRPAVATLNDLTVVVLDYAGTDTVDVWHDGSVSQYPITTPVTEVTDPEQAQTTVRRALLSLNHQRAQANQEQDEAGARNTATLDQIRIYAIDKHRLGAFDRSDLNEFLDHFGLKLYDPHIHLTIQFTGSFEVATADVPAARSLASEALRIGGTDRVCDLDPNSLICHTDVIDVTDVSAGTSPRLRLSYRLIGTAVVASDDVSHVRTDTETQLVPDLSNVPNLVPGSERHEIQIEPELAD